MIPSMMRDFLQGRIDLVKALRDSSLPVTHHDFGLILTAVISACAACRWPGEGFESKAVCRIIDSIQLAPSFTLISLALGRFLSWGSSPTQTPWGTPDQEIRIFTGDEIDRAILRRWKQELVIMFGAWKR
jgi:hypothetical protein